MIRWTLHPLRYSWATISVILLMMWTAGRLHLVLVNIDWLREAALVKKPMTQADGAAVHRERLKEQPDWFGEDIRRRLEDGAKTTSTEYILARRTQAEVRKKCEQFFESHDL